MTYKTTYERHSRNIPGQKKQIVLINSYCLLQALWFGSHQANLVLIAYASSEGSGEPAHPRSLARTFAARSYKQWVKRNLQTESQIPGSSEWLGMRSWNLSWRNARRHKFAWLGSFMKCFKPVPIEENWIRKNTHEVPVLNILTSLGLSFLYRGFYMSAHVLLNLLKELGKKIRCEVVPSILTVFPN